MSKKTKYISFPIFALALILSGLFSRLYDGIDNYLIANVTAGVYGSNSYCIFIGAGLNAILSRITTLLPRVDFFSLLGTVFVFLGFLLIPWLLLRLGNTEKILLSVMALLLTLNLLGNLLHGNFTVLATFFTLIAFLSLFTYLRGKIGVYGLFLGLFYLFLGYQWRAEACLMALPFGLLFLADDLFVSGRKEHTISTRRLFPTLVLASMLLLSCSFWNKSASSSKAEGIRFNSYRSDFVDYANPSYEKVQDSLENLGVSENDYLSLSNLIFADTETVTVDYLYSIYSALEPGTLGPKISVLQGWQIFHTAFSDETVHVEFLVIFLLYIILILSRRELRPALLLSLLGFFLIAFGLACQGRLLSRMLMALILPLSLPILLHASDFLGKVKYTPVLLTVFLAFSIWNGFSQKILCCPQIPLSPRKESSTLADFCDNSTFYLWDVYTLDNELFGDSAGKGQLLTQDFLDNNIPDGEWTYGQDYYLCYMKNNGMQNPMRSLLQENWRYVGTPSRAEIILAWLQEHYNSTVEMKLISAPDGLFIWKFE